MAVLTLAGFGASASILWAVLGWTPMVVIGAATGAWMVAAHGHPGPGFLGAMVTGMLARLLAAVGGAVAVGTTGGAGLGSFLTGLVGGFVPMQAYEVFFFSRAGREGTKRT